MSAAANSPPVPVIDRASDWLNPILVKETRQALKSRQFVATFMLVLVAGWLISVFGVVVVGTGIEYRAVGQYFFNYYFGVLCFAIFIVVPFGAFRSLLSERDLHTWEVLSITTLKPRQIVWGKLSTALVQLFIYYSAITPFIAFANLLKGTDVPTIAFVLVAAMIFSMALSMVALTASTFGTQRYWQVFLTLAVLGALLFAFAMGLTGVFTPAIYAFDEPAFWWTVGIFVAYLVAFCILLLQIAIAQLTFDADNRSTGVRLAAAGIFWMTVALIGLFWWRGGSWGLPLLSGANLEELLRMFAVAAGIFWSITSIFAATEPDALSRRVRRDLSRFGAFRLFTAPWMPGGNRGYLYLLLHLAALWLFVEGLLWYAGAWTKTTFAFITGLCLYVLIFIGIGSATGRLARRLAGDFRPAHTRVLTVLLLSLCSMLPHILDFFEVFRRATSAEALYFLSDPFSTLSRLYAGNERSTLILLILAAVAVITLSINLQALITGVIDVCRQYTPLTRFGAPAVARIIVTHDSEAPTS